MIRWNPIYVKLFAYFFCWWLVLISLKLNEEAYIIVITPYQKGDKNLVLDLEHPHTHRFPVNISSRRGWFQISPSPAPQILSWVLRITQRKTVSNTSHSTFELETKPIFSRPNKTLASQKLVFWATSMWFALCRGGGGNSRKTTSFGSVEKLSTASLHRGCSTYSPCPCIKKIPHSWCPDEHNNP